MLVFITSHAFAFPSQEIVDFLDKYGTESSLHFFQAIQAVLTSIALIIGGAWSYLIFVKKRQKFPRAEVSHKFVKLPFSENKVVLRTIVTIENTGDVLLSLESGFIWVHRISPLTSEEKQEIDQAEEEEVTVSKEELNTEADWPLLFERNFSSKVEVEPHEKDESLCYDFLLDNTVDIIQVYTYFRNQKKRGLFKRHQIGWNKTSVERLVREE